MSLSLDEKERVARGSLRCVAKWAGGQEPAGAREGQGHLTALAGRVSL